MIRFKILLKIFIICLAATLSSCFNSYNSEDKKQFVSNFEYFFGFIPTDSIKNAKIKKRAIFDTESLWMVCESDQHFLNKIVAKDSLLKSIRKENNQFYNGIKSIDETYGTPSWFKKPSNNIQTMYSKLNFLNHTYSECYIWYDKEHKKTYIFISYFD